MSLFDMLRERDEKAEQAGTKASLTNIMAEQFVPKEDITAYEMSLILKLFCVLSVDGHFDTARKNIIEFNLDRHFIFKNK